MKYALAVLSAFLGICLPTTATGQSITGGTVACTGGAAAGYPCQNVDLIAYLNLTDLGASGADLNDVWGWTDGQTGNEYALVGRTNGVSIVDITNPELPVLIGDLPMSPGTTPNAWRDFKVYRDHMYVVADNVGNHGMQVLDLTQVRNVTSPPVTFTATAIYTQIGSAHNIAINEASGFAYIVGTSSGANTCGGGLHMVDIRTPDSPQFAGCFSDPNTPRTLGSGAGYTHDVQCVIYRGPDTEHVGKEICIGSNESGISVADVTNKTAPVSLGVGIIPNASYIHQGWLTDDHRYSYQNDELNEVQSATVINTTTHVFDLADLDDPQLANTFDGSTTAIDHNLYVVGDYMLQTNYLAGFRVWDIADRVNPTEIGYFDIAPSNDSPSFGGAWSSYPFFKSGVVPVTADGDAGSIAGLYLLRASTTNLTADQPRAGSHGITIDAFPNPATVALTIELSANAASTISVDVVDILGRAVRGVSVYSVGTAGKVSQDIDTGDWPAGVYLIRVSTDSGMVVETIVVD